MITTLVILVGCNQVEKEEKKKIEHVDYLRGIVSELTKARLSNETVEEVKSIFESNKGNIGDEVWEERFNTENVVAVSDLEIAESYGYIPIGSEINIINYGKDEKTSMDYFIVTAEMDVTDESGFSEEVVDVYMVYGFGKENKITDFHLSHQMRGE